VDLRVPKGVRELPLPTLQAGMQPEWLFFTEEASLRRALAGELPGRFLPVSFPAKLLDDKKAFADYLAEDPRGPQALVHWSMADSRAAHYPLLLKARHSWIHGRKLPRGWVCRDEQDLADRRNEMATEGLCEEWFFLQEWLGDRQLRLLSVGGFFDATAEGRNLAVVTERVADYGDKGPSSSAMLVTVNDELGVIERASHVLRRLGYRGPYEFEFIVADHRVLALELNPRFWMQHGLFVAAGNGLVTRYLGRDTVADRSACVPDRLLWVDGTWLLRRLVRLDGRPLALWRSWSRRGYRSVVCPTLGQALWAALWRAGGGGRA
jgi:hypothetical protein